MLGTQAARDAAPVAAEPLAADALDAIVLGGGPAGATAAACLARGGRRVRLFERERFPRFHVGESFLPLANPVLTRLGIGPELEGIESVRKLGATFYSADGARSSRIDFEEAPRVPDPRSFHAVRAELDALLLGRARESGAEVREGCAALRVDLEGPTPRVLVRDEAGEERWHGARYLLDASGRKGVVANQLGLRRSDPDLRKTALFAHFEGIPAPEGRAAGDVRVYCREAGGWFWLIPLPGGRTSLGVVFDVEERPKRPGEDPDACLDRWVAQLAPLAPWRASLRRVSPARWESDFSYSTRRYHGERFLLLGDAGSFIDPVFSSGGQIALAAGAEAADAVEAALQGRGRRALERYDRLQRRRYRFFRRLVLGFYRPTFRELMFEPETWPAGARALASMLAGQDRPGWTNRLRVGILFALVALKERQPPQAK